MSEQPAERLRRILERASSTRLALKRAKAEGFLVAIAEKGATATIAWQRLANHPDIQRLEDEYERARIDLVVENAINWGKVADIGSDPSEGMK